MFAIDIQTYPQRGGTLRVIACIEDLLPIAKILGHIRRREALIRNTPRSPPDLQPELTPSRDGWAETQGVLRLLARISNLPNGFSGP
ncbi:MAG: hypothetical protein P8Y52_09205 [Xanthomonadales bacterium]